jgi:hypothetical protein
LTVLERIKERVNDIAEARDLKDNRAFGYWFLEEVDDFSEEEALDLVVDGPWDNGRDAVYQSEDESEVRIYQFKYSRSAKYIEKAFADIQRAALYEEEKLKAADTVVFHVVTIGLADETLKKAHRAAERRIRKWMKDRGYAAETTVEFQDLRFFTQLFEQLYGISVDLKFASAPVTNADALLGLIDVAALRKRVGEEELLAFNIRKFLGLHKGSVNAQIKQSLEDDDNRHRFWLLNNGIVCLCTGFEPAGRGTYTFENFTIVNGAQTVNTVARFLDDNPAVTDPVWVVGKIIKVPQNDIEQARLLTKTSNTQSPTNNKDLRAVDKSHRRLKEWAQKFFAATYAYRRGERVPREATSATMKDVAQAFVAYCSGEPNVPFARVGTIFSNSSYYDAVFPAEEIDRLRRTGTSEEIREFMLRRLFPARLVRGVREFIGEQVDAGDEKRWRSLAYHIAWVISELPSVRAAAWKDLYDNVDAVVAGAVPIVYGAMKFFVQAAGLDVPRDLKTTKLVDELRTKDFLKQEPFKNANKAAAAAL